MVGDDREDVAISTLRQWPRHSYIVKKFPDHAASWCFSWPTSQRVSRVKAVTAFLKAGIPLNKIGCFTLRSVLTGLPTGDICRIYAIHSQGWTRQDKGWDCWWKYVSYFWWHNETRRDYGQYQARIFTRMCSGAKHLNYTYCKSRKIGVPAPLSEKNFTMNTLHVCCYE